MYAYDVKTVFSIGQTNIVVADNYAEAERIFKHRYGFSPTIVSISKIADYVLVSGIDDLLPAKS